jgi:hypothetical protein
MKLAEVHYFTDHECDSPIWLDIPLDDDPVVTPDIAWIFAHGQCHALGAALHEILGWPIVGCYATGQGDLRTKHVALQLPNYGLADITGICSGDETGRRPLKVETIVRGRMGGFLPPAMEFARHYAPVIADALLKQNVKYDQRPPWPFKRRSYGWVLAACYGVRASLCARDRRRSPEAECEVRPAPAVAIQTARRGTYRQRCGRCGVICTTP